MSDSTDDPEDLRPSWERLAEALEADGDPKLAPLAVAARKKLYSEFDSPLTFPLRVLVAALEERGRPDFALRVKAGEFDAGAAEADAWYKAHGEKALRGRSLDEFMRETFPDVDIKAAATELGALDPTKVTEADASRIVEKHRRRHHKRQSNQGGYIL